MQIRIALVGDFDPGVTAHRAIPIALERASQVCQERVTFDWKHTSALGTVEGYHGVWCVPASPYANEISVLAAIRFAREHGVPCFGTCGGFQHAVLEFARNVLNLADAEHAETAADNSCLVISRLSCSLVEVEQAVTLIPGSAIYKIYGAGETYVSYHCNFGLNPRFEEQFQSAGMRVTARDAAGEVRAMEIPDHPFFIGTLFQPERLALENKNSPLVDAFVKAAAAFASQRG